MLCPPRPRLRLRRRSVALRDDRLARSAHECAPTGPALLWEILTGDGAERDECEIRDALHVDSLAEEALADTAIP